MDWWGLVSRNSTADAWGRPTWSFSGLSETSFRLVDVRFLGVVVGLSVQTGQHWLVRPASPPLWSKTQEEKRMAEKWPRKLAPHMLCRKKKKSNRNTHASCRTKSIVCDKVTGQYLGLTRRVQNVWSDQISTFYFEFQILKKGRRSKVTLYNSKITIINASFLRFNQLVVLW